MARRHLLLPELRTDDVTEIVRALVALHSTDPVTVYLSVLSRMRNPDLAAVDEALYESRSIVRHHAMRRTLWVTTPDMARTMHAAATRKVAQTERRRTISFLGENDIDDPEAWLDSAREKVVATLREHGPMTARDLGRRVPELARPLRLAPGKPYAATQAAHTRVLSGLGFDGVLIRARPTGTWVNGQYTWYLMEDWVEGGVDGEDERTAARDLAHAWLTRFGPGTTTDLQWWAGWTLGMTRRALEDCGAVEISMEGGTGWVAPYDGRAPQHVDVAADAELEPEPWVALLPSLDPTVMGWKERGFYLPQEALPAWDRNGNAGPTVWVDGRVVGAWGRTQDGEIRLHWFLDVPAERRAEVAARAEEVQTWLGTARYSVRFPGAINATLVGR
jgi:Winged helix DNA-binding domain